MKYKRVEQLSLTCRFPGGLPARIPCCSKLPSPDHNDYDDAVDGCVDDGDDDDDDDVDKNDDDDDSLLSRIVIS